MSDMVQMMLVADCLPESEAPLAEALQHFDISCVLIAPPGWQAGIAGNEDKANSDVPSLEPARMDQARCQDLVRLIQDGNAAAIIANDAQLAAAISADGCHLEYTDDLEDTYQTCRNFLGKDAIVGIMPGPTRHMAMTLAEAGADYVSYAIRNEDDATALEYVAWWAEIFETPVVTFTSGDIAVCRRAIAAGPPDFLAMPLLTDSGIEHLSSIARLIEESGQLPIATKDAK